MGHIVITREAGIHGDHYSVRTYPGLAQVSYPSFEMALDVSTRLERSAGVWVWHEENGRFTLIESRVDAVRA